MFWDINSYLGSNWKAHQLGFRSLFLICLCMLLPVSLVVYWSAKCLYSEVAHVNRTYKELFYWFCFAFSHDSKRLLWEQVQSIWQIIFFEKTKLPFTHFFSPFSSKVESQVTHLKQASRKQHSNTKQLLQKFSLKKKSSYKNYTYKCQMFLEQNQNI